MATDNEIDNETAATEEKAKQIGKDIGVEEDDIPDFDIQEEEDTGEDDKVLAKEREPRKERPKLSAKEKRELKKKKINEKFSYKDEEIASLRAENEQMKRWQSDVNGRLAGISKAEVDKGLNDTSIAFHQAEKDYADAFAEGDGVKATKAMRVMYDAQRRIEQLQAVKGQLEKAPAQEYTETPVVDRTIANKAKSWAERNSWYDPSGKDSDSAIAKALSGVLANEGYDPKSDDFWEELDERLEERKIGKREEDEEYEEEDEPALKAAKKRAGGPPIMNGSTRSDLKGKKTVTLPTKYIQMLKDNGIWSDIPRRNKIIAERERILRESKN